MSDCDCGLCMVCQDNGIEPREGLLMQKVKKLTAERDALRAQLESHPFIQLFPGMKEKEAATFIENEKLRAENKRLNEILKLAASADSCINEANEKLDKATEAERDRYREALERIAKGKHWKGCSESIGIHDYCNCTDEIAKAALAEGDTNAESLGDEWRLCCDCSRHGTCVDLCPKHALGEKPE